MGRTWQSFAQKMIEFNFECIGEKLTDDEEKIGNKCTCNTNFKVPKKLKYIIESLHLFEFPIESIK